MDNNNNNNEVTQQTMNDLFEGLCWVLQVSDNATLVKPDYQKFVMQVLTDRQGVSVRMRDALLKVFSDADLRRKYLLNSSGSFNNSVVTESSAFATYLTTLVVNKELWVNHDPKDKGNLMSLIAGLLLLGNRDSRAYNVALAGLKADPTNGLCVLISKAVNVMGSESVRVFRNSMRQVTLDEILMGNEDNNVQ